MWRRVGSFGFIAFLLAACTAEPAFGPSNATRSEWRSQILACNADDVARMRDAHPMAELYHSYPNIALALVHLQSRASAGDVDAMAQLAGLRPYDDPDPATLDYARQAAEAGSPLALYLIGMSNKYGGWGQETELRLAEQYFLLAYDEGVAAAAYEIAELYWIDGLEPDPEDTRSAHQIAYLYALQGSALCEPDAMRLLQQISAADANLADDDVTEHVQSILETLEDA